MTGGEEGISYAYEDEVGPNLKFRFTESGALLASDLLMAREGGASPEDCKSLVEATIPGQVEEFYEYCARLFLAMVTDDSSLFWWEPWDGHWRATLP